MPVSGISGSHNFGVASTPARQQTHALRPIDRRSWHATSIKFSSQHTDLAGGISARMQ